MNTALLKSLLIILIFSGKISFGQDLAFNTNGKDPKITDLNIGNQYDSKYLTKGSDVSTNNFQYDMTDNTSDMSNVTLASNKSLVIKTKSYSKGFSYAYKPNIDNCKLKNKYLAKGIAFTSIGVVMLTTGIVLFENGLTEDYVYNDDIAFEKMIIGGVLAAGLIPFMIIGPISFGKFGKYSRECKKGSTKIHLNPTMDISNHNFYKTKNTPIVGLRINAAF